MKISKYIFIFLNGLIFLTTTIITVLAILLLTSRKIAEKAFNFILINESEWIDMVLIIGRHLSILILPLSLLIWLSAICGLAGACNKNCLVLIQVYIAVQFLMVLATLTIILLVGLRRTRTEKQIVNFVRFQLYDHYDGDHSGGPDAHGATLLIDALQIHFSCCGVEEGAADFTKASAWSAENRRYESSENGEKQYQGLAYPASCCSWKENSPKRFVLPFALANEDECMAHSIALGETRDDEDWQDDEEIEREDDEEESFETDDGSDNERNEPINDSNKAEESVTNAQRPCVVEMKEFFDEKVGVVYAALGIAISVEMLMSFIACVVARKIKN